MGCAIFGAVVALTLSGAAFAQQPPDNKATAGRAATNPEAAGGALSAERPGFTNGTETVARGHFQLELGYQYTKAQGQKEHQVGNGALLRYPLNDHTEVRLGLPSYDRFSGDGGSLEGWENASVSAKWRFLEAKGGLPSLALIAGTSLPTGKPEIAGTFWQPAASLEASRDITEKLTLQASGNYVGAGGMGRRFDQFGAAVNVGYILTDTTGAFIEAFRYFAGEDTPHATYLDGGVIFTLNRNLAVDVNGGKGITGGVRSDYFVGAGVARRW